MYVVTFYSFKGGVGRTLALVNVAAALRRMGRRVLLVDFDLEAPGITSFSEFAKAKNQPGIVDFIGEYLSTGSAPDVANYLTQCDWPTASAPKDPPSGSRGEIWIMPAGKQDASYSQRLSSIDWQDLYASKQGFLLLEDLRAQWHATINPDYVLLDSRTGHTDVGGICTRQLPDAVVAMLFPNDQNISGVAKIVDDIKSEGAANRARDRDLAIHYVLSNVPNLDDEDGVLHKQIERARELLGLGAPAAILHHYASLSLLDQEIFVEKRPRSQLANEYRSLAQAIVCDNLSDRQGAIATLRRLESTIEKDGDLDVEFEDALDIIAAKHGGDKDILLLMAKIRERLGSPAAAMRLLDGAVEAGIDVPEVLRRRASIHKLLGNTESAIADLRRLLEKPGATATDVFFAVLVLRFDQPRALLEADSLPAIVQLPPKDRARILPSLLVSEDLAKVAERLALPILQSGALPPKELETLENKLALCLMAQKRFPEAAGFIANHSAGRSRSLSELFNEAAAEWGQTGRANPELFRNVITAARSLRGARNSPNYYQCMGLACLVTGDCPESKDYIAQARRSMFNNPRAEFSAWRYLEVAPDVFIEDLNEMQRSASGESALRPRFLSASCPG